VTKRRPLRRAGARWRIKVDEPGVRSYAATSGLGHAGGSPHDSDARQTVVWGNTEFDELVIGQWIHLEQMDTGSWWMNIGGVTLWVRADRDGRPISVDVYGPGDYAPAVEDVKYGGSALETP
jgi:hypothetical protein